jgi:hypothetical protein
MKVNQKISISSPKRGQTKAIIFDASTLISFAMNGLLPELKALKKSFSGKFIITQDVKREVIDKPLTIKRFELEALKVKHLMNEKIIELPLVLGVKNSEILQLANDFLERANNIFIGRGKNIKLISMGEATCLALSRILNNKKIENVVAVDERTTRMLIEKPENLRKIMQKKLHMKVDLNKDNFKIFKGFKLIRSVELIYVAYKKGLIRLKDPLVLDALLWALKFKGCSVSGKEINEIKALG